MKKVISIILSLAMLFSLLPMQVFAADRYTDTAGNWAEGAIDRWSEYGVIEGSNGKFDPSGTLTRAQMAAILSRLLALPEAKSAGFSDVAETEWYAPYIDRCYAAGIMQGSNGKAQPNDPITREQAIVMLGRALGIKPIENADLSGYTDALTVSDWAKGYVAAMAQAGIVKGTSATTVSPKASIDRAATVTILDRAIGTYANVDGAEAKAANSGIILIAADNVKVTGAAKGATVIVSSSADGVTVNGAAVAAGTTTAAVEEKPNNPVPSGGGGDPTLNYSDLTISEAKTVTGGTYKDVTITAAVGNGDVTLDNVTINGKLIVQGGGENSIHLDGCKVDTIQVDKDTTAQDAQQPRIELSNTPVETIEAVQPVIIEADTASTVKAVEAKSDVTVQGENTKVEKVTVPEAAASEGVKLTVDGAAVENVTAEKPVTIEATSEKSTIKAVEAKSDVTVQGAATEVGNVTIPESASEAVTLKVDGAKVKTVAAEKPVTIEAKNNASPIEKVEAKSNVTVDGAKIDTVTVPENVDTKPEITVTTGAVSTVEAKSEVKVDGGSNTIANVKAEAPVEVASATVVTVTVTVTVQVTVTGNQPVEVAVAAPVSVKIAADNGNSVAVSTTVNTGVDVKLNNTQVTHIHKWNETSRTPATCSKAGSVTYTCVGEGTCDRSNTKTETLPMLPHTEQILPAQAATCTETGLTAGKVCVVCEATLVAQQTVPALGHAYAAVWSSDSTNHWHECKRCGDKTDTAAHTPGAAATETTDQTCTVCGYVITPSLGHQCKNHLTKTAAKTATCTVAGNSEYYTCTCGKFYSDANATHEIAKDSWVVAATGHAYGTPTYEWKAVSGGYTCTATRVCAHNENHKETETVTASYAVTENPTCQKEGTATYTAAFTSPFTQQTMDDVKIAKLLHTEVKVNGTPATCEETGLTDGVKCSVCGTVLVAQEEIPALGHDWATEWSKNGTQHWHVCQREGCDAKNDVANHTPGTAATETTAQICTVCGYEIEPATGHVCKNHLTKHDAVSATCTTAGNSAYWSCTCGKFYSDANVEHEIVENSWVMSALGHNWATEWSKDGTHHWHVCTRDGCTAIDGKTAHTWNEGEVTTPAAGTQDGIMTYTCTACAATRTETIPASFVGVSTVEELAAAMSNNGLLGAELAADLTLNGTVSIPVGRTLIVPTGKTLTVAGELRVYGTLVNKGTALNQNFIDVFGGGTLTNSGTITGSNPDENGVYGSSLGIEGGATLTNNGIINDCIAVADYYGYGVNKETKLCTVNGSNGSFNIASGNFEKMAVVFDAEKIQMLLDNSAYELVVPCGTNATQDNTIDLSGITVPAAPAGKTLLLKNSVFDGTNTYQNSFTVNSGTLTVSEGAYLICRDSTVTVASGATLNAYDYTRFATLVVNGHVYTEKGGMQVTNALTVNQGGVLEIGSESVLDYQGTNDAVINGTLMKTVRYHNGLADGMETDGGNIWMQSEFSDNIKTKVNATMTTLVITQDTTLSGNNIVDVVIPVSGTLSVAPGGSLKYKEIHREAGFIGLVAGNISEQPVDGYYTLTSDFLSVENFTDFKTALENKDATGVYVNANIGVPAQNEWMVLDVAKPVVVASGKALTVEGYTTEEEKFGFLANDLTIVEGGSLTLEEGAALATTASKSGDNEPFYNYTGRVCVSGGKLDISAGSVTDGSFFNYSYGTDCTDSNALILGSNTPEIEFSVTNEAQLRAAIGDGKCTGGVIVEDDITLTKNLDVTKLLNVNTGTLTVPAGKTLTVAEDGFLQVSDTLNVYGTLNNEGGIFNLNLIDVFGGTLSNSGEINGDWSPNESGEFSYNSDIGIENGATINNFIGNDGGVVNDHITVADYWHTVNGPTKRCEWHVLENDHTFDPVFADGDNPNFDVMALAFGTEQVKTALNAMRHWGDETEQHSAYTYEYVLPCGTATEGVNTVELGDITVHEFGALLLKDEVFDGTNVYRNEYKISSGKTLTLQEGAALNCVGQSTLTIDGDFVNNGGFVDFNQFNLSGTKVVQNAAELAIALETGGTIILLPFAEGDENRVKDNWEGQTVYESRYHITDSDANYTISNNTELIGLAEEGLPIAVFFDDGFAVAENMTLKIDGLNIVAVRDSTVNGTVEVRNGKVVVEKTEDAAQDTVLTINGKIFVGEGGALATFHKPGNKIVNHGTIENFGELIFERDPQKGQFEGNDPVEYANLRDLACELYHRFDGYSNMESVDFETVNEWGIEDLHWVYEYPDGGSQLFHGGNDPDFEAIAAFSWLIKNGIIPQYNKETSPELRPYDLVTKAQAAELLNKLGKKIAGEGNIYSTLSSEALLSRGELDQAVDALEIAVRKASGENIVQNAAELEKAFKAGGKIYLLPLAQGDKTEVTFAETGEKSYESQYHLTNACTISKDTELIKLGDEDEPVAVFFDGGFAVDNDVTLGIDRLNIVAGANSEVTGTVVAHNGQVVVQGANNVGATLTINGRIDVGEGSALAIYQNGNKIVNNGGIDVLGELIAPKDHSWDEEDDQHERIYVVENDGSYINFYPDVMEFGKRLLERVEAYGLPEMDNQERKDNREGAKDWPGDDGRIDGFEFLVKNGGVKPVSEGEGEGSRNVWKPYDKIRYGEAINILTNVYKAIDKGATGLPTSVALGDEYWTPNDNDCISDNDVDELLDEFVEVLPPVEADVFTFIVERKNCEPSEGVCDGGWHELVNGSRDNTIRNLHFTEAVTISNATTGLPENDTWGGKIRFEGCVFDCDVNVIYNPTCDFRVEFDKNCEFKNGAKVDVKQAQSEDSKELLANRNVTVYFDCTGGKVVSSARVRAEAKNNVSFLFNGVTVSGTNADNGGFGACMYFNCDAKHDNFNWDENDHSACEGNVCGEYQFTTDGDATMRVTGSTAGNYPIRLSGIVNISGLTAQQNQEITLHNWSKCRDNNGNETEHNTDVNIGDHSVSINDSGDYVVSGTGTVTVHNQDENTRITVNGKELGSPHVFGTGNFQIFLPLRDYDSTAIPITVAKDKTELNYTVENKQDGSGIHLVAADEDNWITDPNDVRLTVTVNGLSVVYDPLKYKGE